MNINQLKYFVSVYESHSFSKAAQKRDVTVQAVSKSISDLEQEFPDSLFVRTNQGTVPTSLGKEFYRRAIPVLKAFGQLEAFAHGNEELGNIVLPIALPHARRNTAAANSAVRLSFPA